MIRHAVLACLVACAILTVGLVGCVDIPTTGPTVPDYRSQLRVMHQAYTVDTLALLQGSQSSTKPSDTTLTPIGPDVERTIRDTVITFTQYKRIRFDFASAMDILIDRAVVATLSNGQATGYLDVPSGARKIQLRGTGTWVDSLSVEDTLAILSIDTVKSDGRVTQKKITSSELNNDNFFPLAPDPVTTIVDSLQALQSTGTELKATLLLAYDNAAAIAHIPESDSRNGAVRYGRIRYRYAGERSTFAPGGKPDSLEVRYMNASKSQTTTVDAGAPGRDVDVANLGYAGASGYTPYRSTGVASYTYRFLRNLTSTIIDSTVVTPAGKKRITIVLVDSLDAGGALVRPVTRVYEDE
jgi:hypothetical protein